MQITLARRARLSALALTLAAAALAAAAALPAGASAASTGPCLAGTKAPRCHFWTGKVTFIADGDTIDVRLDSDHRVHPIRFTGINAMELHRYSKYASRRRGDCHGVEAVDRLEQLLRQGHMRVRLAAQHPSSRSGHRLRRQVSTRIGGHWVDLNRTMVAEGWALWLPNIHEYAWNREYSTLAEEAAAKHVNLWNPLSCPGAPDPQASMRMWVKSDADGQDAKNLDDEWVKIQNLDPANPVPLGGWWVRDSWLGRFTFPAGAAIPPGGTITLHVGAGRSSGDQFYWNRRAPIFENVTHDRKAMGDGAYLFDPSGDLRQSFTYPCRVSCADPLQGLVQVGVQPHRDETVTVTDVGAVPIDLYGYELAAWPRAYDFPPGTVLQPGQTLELDVGGSPAQDTPLDKHWGISQRILADKGGAVSLRSFEDVTLACSAWGRGSC